MPQTPQTRSLPVLDVSGEEESPSRNSSPLSPVRMDELQPGSEEHALAHAVEMSLSTREGGATDPEADDDHCQAIEVIGFLSASHQVQS